MGDLELTDPFVVLFDLLVESDLLLLKDHLTSLEFASLKINLLLVCLERNQPALVVDPVFLDAENFII